MSEKLISIEEFKTQLEEDYSGQLPISFTSSTIHKIFKKNKPFIAVRMYQSNKFEKFESNKFGYRKAISKSINHLI